MKTIKILLLFIIFSTMLSCSKDDSNIDNKEIKNKSLDLLLNNEINNVSGRVQKYPVTLNTSDKIGKKTADAIIKLSIDLNMNEFENEINEISDLVDIENESIDYEMTESDLEFFNPIFKNFSSFTSESIDAYSEGVKNHINSNDSYSQKQIEYITLKLDRFEWLVFGYEEVQRYPPPANGESFDNYIDRCMTSYLQGIEDGTFVEQAWFMIKAAVSTTVALASCTESYITG